MKGQTVRAAKANTPSLSCVAKFRVGQQKGKVKKVMQPWSEHMFIELPEAYKEHFGKPLESIPGDLLKEAKRRLRTTILAALDDTTHRNVDLNIFMAKRPYIFPCASCNQMLWATVHDERWRFQLCNPSLSKTFVDDVLERYRQQQWADRGIDVEDDSLRTYIDTETLIVTGTYSCHYCGMAGSRLTGFDIKPGTENQPWRWGCVVCAKYWKRLSTRAMVMHVAFREMTFSFFSRWPLSRWAKENWPDIYHKAVHHGVKRTTYYMKYDPFPVLRGAPPSDDPQCRLDLAEDMVRDIWNAVLPNEVFATTQAQVREACFEAVSYTHLTLPTNREV